MNDMFPWEKILQAGIISDMLNTTYQELLRLHIPQYFEGTSDEFLKAFGPGLSVITAYIQPVLDALGIKSVSANMVVGFMIMAFFYRAVWWVLKLGFAYVLFVSVLKAFGA